MSENFPKQKQTKHLNNTMNDSMEKPRLFFTILNTTSGLDPVFFTWVS